MIPAPTTSRSASAPRPADLGWEPDTRRGDEHDHPYVRGLAGIGCGIAAAPILYLLIVAAAYGGRLGPRGVPLTAFVIGLLLVVLLVPIVPIVLAWRWTNPAHYAVVYAMIWAPFGVVALEGFTGDPYLPLLIEFGLFSLGLPLCVVAWADWIQVLWKRRVLRVRRGAYAGDWRIVAAGFGMYLAGVVFSLVSCGAALLLLAGAVLVTVGFLMPGPRPFPPQGVVYGFPVATGPPPGCPNCAAPLVWAPSVGRWFCPRCGAYL